MLLSNALIWRSGLAIDCDGCPRAYHPISHLGLDNLANAGHPGNWWGLACDKDGKPYVQGEADPCPGYYVSTTSLVDHNYPESNPRRYVDAELVPYITMTRPMMHQSCKVGDIAMVHYNGVSVPAIVADVGPHPGEGSIALAKALGIPSDPRRGGISSPVVSFIIFLGSAKGWPREDMATVARTLFDAWGGEAKLGDSLG